MNDEEMRKIEKIIDNYHKGHEAFRYSRATTVYNLLRVFEDCCRLKGNYEMASTGFPEMMEISNRYYLDALNMSIRWAYVECQDDNTIDLTSDERYLTFYNLLNDYAKPYEDICSAYISYSRKFFSASIVDNRVLFSINKPIPKVITADTAVEIEQKHNYDKTKLFNVISQARQSRSELIAAINTDNGHVNYNISEIVWENTRKLLKFSYEESSELPEDWVVDEFTLKDFHDVWIALSTWMMIHSISCMKSGIVGGALEDIILVKTKDDIVNFIIEKTSVSSDACFRIIDLLIYNPEIKNNDVIYQPILPLTTGQYALTPYLFICSSPERNLISLVNKIQTKSEYSVFTNKRELLFYNLINNEIKNKNWFTDIQINLPSPLPDIDMVIYDINNKALLLCELKWLTPADSTSEVYARQDDIDKGVGQSEKTLRFVKDNIEEGVNRCLKKYESKDIDNKDIFIGACVISKNIIRTTLDSIPVINYNQFIELCKQKEFNLKNIIISMEEREFFSKLPQKYSERYTTIEYSGYIFQVPSVDFTPEEIKMKVGRNDPCPCGKSNPISGKPMKYKKCCGKDI